MAATLHPLHRPSATEPKDFTDGYLAGLEDGRRHTTHALIWLTAILTLAAAVVVIALALRIGGGA